ncbi:peroxiredoxin family protein [Tenacibaculum sp. S7007]|uniref:thioredoxin-dependent peroxiredoxin n=1 Tax=Tenacibaculum pelagium TaxID=2759527 RepID=A0A839AMP2_9FLAO|nr:peroxiredoxin family protein [Tenacibaculum pelagium]MBA6156372.1 peroxiredoxin family protein [Tenacibaculum pelagium]
MKNFTKSLFISGFPVVALIIFVKTVIDANFNISNIGILISSITVVVFFSMLFIKPVARTTKTLTFYSTLIVIGLALNLFNFEQRSLLISVGLALGWLAYLTWYSSFNSRNTAVLDFGKTLPNFTLENGEKEKISLNDLSGDFKIFIFYRGNWCPLCMAQIKEVVNEYKELDKRNADMVLVSSQPHKFTKSLAKKHKVPFHFLVDSENKVAKKLGILHENGLPAGFQILGYESDVVLPTVIITDKNNKIIFADLTDNYRVRPEPETFMKIIDNYKG